MYQIQDVVKCYLFFIFTRFLWTHALKSKTTIKNLCLVPDADLIKAYPWSKKLINDWKIIVVYWEESDRSEALANIWVVAEVEPKKNLHLSLQSGFPLVFT